MRILMWSSLYKPFIGGVERYLERLVKGLTRLGCTVEVIANAVPDAPMTETIDDVSVTRLPFPASRRGDMAAIRSVRDGIARVTDRLQPELVNLQTSGPSIVHYELHRRSVSLPLVTTFHGIYPPSAEMLSLLSPHLRRSVGTIAASAAAKASLIAIVGDLAADMDVRLPPIDDERRLPTPASQGTAVVLGVGRLIPEKGWGTLLDAMPLVREAVPHAQLVLVGDGPERERLEGAVATRGLGSFVRLTGLVDDNELIRLVDGCNVACVPSLDEGFGMVAIEASMRARPVVASRVGGLVEAVVDGVTGLLVPPADPRALADALVRVLVNEALARELGRRGREFASAFTSDALAAATLGTFRRALAGSRS